VYKLSSLLILILLLPACSLTGEQENRLSKQLSKYVKSYNMNNTLEYAGLTHPAVVKYYAALGDSSFINHFGLNLEKENAELSNPLYREMKIDGNWMERKYTIERKTSEQKNRAYELYAISSDGGENWFFLTEEDYKLKKIPLKKRLFSN
jgi:hypothetical protein